MSREMDREVAEKVLGCNPVDHPHHWYFKTSQTEWIAEAVWGVVGGYSGPAFTTDIAAVWMVVEHMRELGWALELHVDRHGNTVRLVNFQGKKASANAPTMPEAICTSALRALEEA